MVKNILIFGHANIGDVCYDLAVINPLCRAFPQAKISFLTSSRCRDFVQGYKGITQIITFDRHGKDKGFSGHVRFIARLRQEKFDMAVFLTRSLAYWFLGIPQVWCVKKSAREPKHPVDRYLALLRSHGVEANSASFDYNLDRREDGFCADFCKQHGIGPDDVVVGIMPLAAWSLKSWPIQQWNSLVEVLTGQYGIKVINLGKMPDNELGKRIAKEMSGRIIPADQTTLAQAKALLKRCRIFIGPDSSLLHVASCMGVETIGLYGPTSGEHFYPYFHRHNVLSAHKRLPCMPCYPGTEASCCAGEKKCDFGPCMDAIRVEDVVALVREKLKVPG